MPRTSDKRERLIKAAKFLFHKQGFTNTTLADIAEESKVPLGNVYYYFRTKEELGAAVIDDRRIEFDSQYQDWSSLGDPRERLFHFLDQFETHAELVVQNGCPIGSLCQELNKADSSLSDLADGMLENQLEWLTDQFAELEHNNPRKIALHLVTSLQGGSLLANALQDVRILTEEIQRLRRLISKI